MYTFKTSGTSNQPKIFTLTDEQLLARVASRIAAKGKELSEIKSLFCTIPLTSTAGMTYRIWAEQNRINFFTPQSSVESNLLLFRKEKIEGIVGDASTLENLSISGYKFKYILVSGTRVSPDKSKLIRTRMGNNLFVSYGASEVGSISIATANQVETIPGCVGKLCPGALVKFDINNQILVKTSTMISGYDDSSLTPQYFQHGWFLTGDIGEIKEGLLTIKNRINPKKS
jgi:acyl-CoA synthetase (AMP-forming)/AMP-acid ligase II